MVEKVLMSLGLTGNETKIYLTLLKIGSATAGEITSRCGIHRRNVYDSIERLMEKGLVSSVIINNKKYFQAEEPERFISLIDEKKSLLEEQRNIVKEIIPSLKPIQNQSLHTVKFFKGKEGLKSVYEDILKTGKSYIGYGPGEQVEVVLSSYLKHYVRKRLRKKLQARLILEDSARGKWFTKNKLLDVKYLPDNYSSHAALRIYGNKVALILFSKDEPLAIVIENKSIADGYRKYFEILWNSAEE